MSFRRLLLFSLPLAIGVYIGSRRFGSSSPESFKRFAIWLLLFIAVLGLLRFGLDVIFGKTG